MWFTPTGAEPSRMVVAIQKRTLTYDFLLERGEFVMSAPTDEMMDLVVDEVLATHIRRGAMEGELYRPDANPLLYMGTKYNAQGKSQGKYYARLSGIGLANYDPALLKKYLSQAKKRTRKEE